MKYFFSAGEASGDVHAAQVIRELRRLDGSAEIAFLGGDEMAAAAGRDPLIHYRRMAYMGFIDVARHLPEVLGNLAEAKRAIAAMRPDALVLVDYPGFNLKLAEYAHGLGIPVHYYIAPKLWAWKEYRIKKLRRYVDRLYSILPFEPQWFGERGVKAEYVGNPSVEEIGSRMASMMLEADFRSANMLGSKPFIALVPGSRRSEIESNLPVMAEAARVLGTKYQAVVGGAPGIEPEFYKGLTDLPVLYDCTTPLMAHATVALVTSGTATLECALIGTPQVICYRHTASRITYAVMSRVLKIPYVSLPNLIADREVVPELLMHKCTPLSVLRHIVPLLPGHEGRARQIEGYGVIRQRLGTADAAATAAGIIVGDLTPSTPQRPE